MKKIISLLIAVMMFASLSLTSFAATTTITFSAPVIEIGAGKAVVDLTLNLSDVAELGMLQFNFLLPEGVTLETADFSEFTELYDTTAVDDNNFAIGQIIIYEDDMTTAIPAGTDTINFPITFAVDSSVATTYEIALDEGNTFVMDPAGEFLADTFPSTTITVKAEEPTPSVNIVDAAFDTVQKADTVAGEATDYQYGSAIGVKGTTGDATFKKMIWAITIGSDRLYSEAFDVSLNGDFKVAATFINGNKVEENNAEFSDAGAIFLGEDGEDYFTDETDADNKAE